jgi:hypothetical protein
VPSGTPAGGSGGPIYTDGDTYSLCVDGSVMDRNCARQRGGDGIFRVVNNDQGALTVEYSALHDNPSGQFQVTPGVFEWKG